MSAQLPKVKSELAGGFRDYLPPEMIARQRMITTIRDVFERFGFDPLDTPGMERRSTLTGGDPDFRMRIYDARVSGERIVVDPADPDGDRIALRFDLTVPLARVVAANLGGDKTEARKFRLPFKRYQVGMVWRGEKPQAGRFREFMQFDADVVGTATPVADAEIVALMVATMRALGVERFQVRFNNRKLLNGLSGYAGFDSALAADVLRIIDKLPKIGRDAVLRELAKAPQPVEPVRTEAAAHVEEGAENEESTYGLGLSSAVVGRIAAFLDLQGTTDELLDRASALFAGVAIAEEGIAELRAIVVALRAMSVDEQCWQFDLSIARGLAYYTGPVFETFLVDAEGKPLTLPRNGDGAEEGVEQLGSVFSGGRYDDLVTRFLEDPIPATGASIGVDRLFDYLTRLGKITLEPTRTQVLVTVMDPAALSDYLAMVGELRSAGIRTMLWVGEETAFKAQLAYANGKEIPVVIIAGDRERAAGTVAVKNMRARTPQEVVPRANLVGTVQAALGITHG